MGKEDHTREKHIAMYGGPVQKDVAFKYGFFANVAIMTAVMAYGFVGVKQDAYVNGTKPNTTVPTGARLLRSLSEAAAKADYTGLYTTTDAFDAATCEFAFACQMYDAAKPKNGSSAPKGSNKCLKYKENGKPTVAEPWENEDGAGCADLESLREMYYLAGEVGQARKSPFVDQGPNGDKNNAFWSTDYSGVPFPRAVAEFLINQPAMKINPDATNADALGNALNAFDYKSAKGEDCQDSPFDAKCTATYTLEPSLVLFGLKDFDAQCNGLGDSKSWRNNSWTVACVANSDPVNKSTRMVSNLRMGFFFAIVASFVMSALWLCIIKACSTIIVKVFFFSIIGTMLLAAAVIYSLTKNVPAAAPPAVLGLGIAAWFFMYGMKRLAFVGENLAVSITIIQTYPKTVVYSLLVCIPQTIWLFIWVMGAIGVYGTMEANNAKKEARCELARAGTVPSEGVLSKPNAKGEGGGRCMGIIPPQFVVFLLYVSLFWGVKCLSYIVHCTIAGTAGTWWFRGNQEENVVRDSFNRAAPIPGKGESFGSVSKGALLVAIITVLKMVISEKLKKYPVFGVILGVLVKLMEYINKFALVFVALYGMPFSKAGSACFAMFNDFGVATLVNDVMLDIIIFFACIGIGFTTAAVSAGTAFIGYNFPEDTIAKTADAFGDDSGKFPNKFVEGDDFKIDTKETPRALKMWANCHLPDPAKRLPYCDCIGGQSSVAPAHGDGWHCTPQFLVMFVMFFLGLFIGYGVGKTTMVAVESAYDTIFVCFIEDAEPCKSNHPESHEKMMNAWSQTPEFQKLAAEHPKKDQYIVVGTTADGQMVLQKV